MSVVVLASRKQHTGVLIILCLARSQAVQCLEYTSHVTLEETAHPLLKHYKDVFGNEERVQLQKIYFASFLQCVVSQNLIHAVKYHIHTILTFLKHAGICLRSPYGYGY